MDGLGTAWSGVEWSGGEGGSSGGGREDEGLSGMQKTGGDVVEQMLVMVIFEVDTSGDKWR